MAIIGALMPEADDSLAGIVEADEARQRESRKGSRVWVRHQRDRANQPAPPRLRWRAYRRRRGSATAPPGGWRAWEKKLLAATDRAGHRAFEVIADAGQAAISGALLPVMAPDAVLCTDGFVTYERIAKDERIPHFALNAGRRTKRTPRSHHIDTVNALISRFRAVMQRLGRPRVEEPRRLRPLARRPNRRGPLLPRCAQAPARFRPSRQHDLLTPPSSTRTAIQKRFTAAC